MILRKLALYSVTLPLLIRPTFSLRLFFLLTGNSLWEIVRQKFQCPVNAHWLSHRKLIENPQPKTSYGDCGSLKLQLIKPLAETTSKIVTLATTGEPFFDQVMLHFILIWEADSSTTIVCKIHVSFLPFANSIQELLDLFFTAPVYRLKLCFFGRRIKIVFTKSYIGLLNTLSPVNPCFSHSITCYRTIDGFLSAHLITAFYAHY